MQDTEKDPSAPRETAMRIIPRGVALTRRGFLKGGGAAAIGAAALSAGAMLAPAREALAESFTVLGPAVGKTLLVMARDIFPHDRISDRYYMLAIEPYEAKAAKDPELKTLLVEGVKSLDALARARFKKPYAEVPTEAERVSLLYGIERGAFFQKVKGDLVTGFYNNPAVWPFFGEEGSAWEKGGYVNRGFDDIDWLPADDA